MAHQDPNRHALVGQEGVVDEMTAEMAEMHGACQRITNTLDARLPTIEVALLQINTTMREILAAVIDLKKGGGGGP